MILWRKHMDYSPIMQTCGFMCDLVESLERVLVGMCLIGVFNQNLCFVLCFFW